MTTYEDVRHADLEWQRQIRAVEVARRRRMEGIRRRQRSGAACISGEGEGAG